MVKKIGECFLFFLIAILIAFVSGRSVQAVSFPDEYIRKNIEEAYAGIEVDVSALGEGEVSSVIFLGRPIYFYRRTIDDLMRLQGGLISRRLSCII